MFVGPATVRLVQNSGPPRPMPMSAPPGHHLEQVIDECAYTIEYAYSDNGKEYKGATDHAFVKLCTQHNIGQKFTRINRPQTNGKAERVIRTLMEIMIITW